VEDLEAKVLSAVLEDKQIHVLLQANPNSLFRTHGDVWEFIRGYYENNMSLPPSSLVVEKFRDFEPVKEVGLGDAAFIQSSSMRPSGPFQ